jgi:hypothetical protein
VTIGDCHALVVGERLAVIVRGIDGSLDVQLVGSAWLRGGNDRAVLLLLWKDQHVVDVGVADDRAWRSPVDTLMVVELGVPLLHRKGLAKVNRSSRLAQPVAELTAGVGAVAGFAPGRPEGRAAALADQLALALFVASGAQLPPVAGLGAVVGETPPGRAAAWMPHGVTLPLRRVRDQVGLAAGKRLAAASAAGVPCQRFAGRVIWGGHPQAHNRSDNHEIARGEASVSRDVPAIGALDFAGFSDPRSISRARARSGRQRF